MYAHLVMVAWSGILAAIFLVPFGGAQEVETPVKVNSVAAFTTPRGQIIFEVDYSYEFIGRDAVYVKGLGSVSAKGNFVYLTDSPRLEFLDAPGGRLIADSGTLGGTTTTSTYRVIGSIQLPSEADFPQAGQDERWEYSTPFQETAMKVLNKNKLSYKVYGRDQLFYLLSTYTPIENVAKNLRVEIALLLSHPYRPKEGEFSFRVQSATRERRIKEDEWRASVSAEVQKASATFVDQFLKELLNLGRSGK